MEYTVGSLADLISGKNTPDKPKVQKLTLKKPIYSDFEPSPKNGKSKHQKNAPERKNITKKKKHKGSPSTGDSDMVVINHEMLLKSKFESSAEGNTSTDGIETKAKKSKKRKLEDEDKPLKLENFKRAKQLNEASRNESTTFKIKRKKKSKSTENTAKKDNQSETAADKLATYERDSRTLFVGNIPVTIKKRQLLRLFSKYGHVESIRLRCIAPAEPGIPKRVAFIKKLMHPKRLTMHSYIRFALRDDALKALVTNGMKYKEHHLRVQISNDSEKPDPRKAIFVGNLPFDVEDEELWNTFESCGTIVSVRIIRDSNTNMGIGIAYVNFESSDAVELALQMEDVTIKKKVIRIHRYSQKKKHGQRHQKGQHSRMSAQSKKGDRRSRNYVDKTNPSDMSEPKTTTIAVKSNVFQGSKSNIKKRKPMLNKGVLNKMKLSKKVAPR